MQNLDDVVSIRALVCECEIGIRDAEKGILQKLTIDVEAEVDPVKISEWDHENAMRLDYSVAAPGIQNLLKSHRFNLIETVAEDIAGYILQKFSVKAVTVAVAKSPLDMPFVDFVSYRCRRVKAS